MSKIDWSKAPEGATHYYHGSSTPWRDLSGDKWKWFSGNSWHCSGYPSSEIMDDYSDRMTEKPSSAWSGEGLPPVGTVCEAMHDDLNSGMPCKAEILKINKRCRSAAFFWIDAPDGMRNLFWAERFRPIRTPEQIAEDERIAGLNEMIRHMKDHPLGTHGASHLQELMIHEDVARDLWEAGYRKQEAK